MPESIIRNAEVGFLGRLFSFPFLGTNSLNNNIVGQVVFLCGDHFHGFRYNFSL